MTLEKLKLLLEAETKPFRDAIKQAKDEMKSSSDQIVKDTSRVKKAFSGIAKIVAGVAIGRALWGFGKQALQTASDLQEVQNVVDVAFGSMKQKCEDFAKTAITKFGMSELSAKQTASTYMAMADGIRIAEDTASDMAIQLAALSGDVASFFNISQSDAATKLKSVFTGETETLKELGVVMTQTNLKQYALSQGMNGNIESMDQASLAMLRYRFVMDALKNAQGDFARTSGSWANQTRILKEQFNQLAGIIGNGLLAVLTPVIQLLNRLMAKFIQVAQIASAAFGAIFGKSKSSKDKTPAAVIADDTVAAVDAQKGLGNAVEKTGSKAKKAAKEMRQLGGFDELNIVQTKQDSDTGSGSGGSGGSSAGIAPISTDFGFDEEIDTSGIQKSVDKVMGYVNKFTTFLKRNKPIIVALLAGMFAGLATFGIVKNFASITKMIDSVIRPLKTLSTGFNVFFMGLKEGSGVMTSLSAVFGTTTAAALVIAVAVAAVTAALVYLWQTSDQFRQIVTDTINIMGALLSNIYNNILVPLFTLLSDIFKTVLMPIAVFLSDVFVTAIDLIISVVLSLWNNVLAPLESFLVDVLAIALQGVIDVWTAWKPVIEMVYAAVGWVWNEILKPIVQWIKDTLIVIFENWGETINDLIPSIKEMFQGLIDFFVGIFTLDVDKALGGIRKLFEGFDNFLNGIFKTDWTKAFGSFGVIINAFCSTMSEIWSAIKKIFSGVIDFVAGVFSGDWNRVWRGVVSIFEGIFEGIAGLIKAPINGVIDIVNWAIDKINSVAFDVPDWIPGIGGKHFGLDIGHIPRLAKGGIVDSPMLSIIGEAGKEAVLPLENNTGWISLLASQISAHGNSQDQGMIVDLLKRLINVIENKKLQVGDREIGEAAQRYNNRKGFSFGTI